ncbi:hypothetical protein EIN_487290 [Entamoeba invadens IP1]|uniref:ShKT domain-containing protein n=1 Tax=Entamoeba invadens IP1 TaxID=370355 RepID=A0A0A1U4R3_ENTIV|nr:hypothetical protein EIN_487290 [Entamoeba invadens IP1]ELP89247.1 hypothetical protein EIN_487290 [Entamoeba invadens IP1]|eukprot:XP_004256018.1 hypothetical protein EIN_487290 [Entamoeba invadens IP1]
MLHPIMFTLSFCLMFSFTMSQSKNAFSQICMPDFLAINMDSSDVNAEIKKECYSNIPNYKHEVKGFDIKSPCYVNEHFLDVNKGDNRVKRCGEWLELVGSSNIPVYCMIAGSFNFTFQGKPFPPKAAVVGVSKNLFNIITKGFYASTDAFAQMTVAETDFDLNVSPSLWVLNNTTTTSFVQITDSNRISEFIELNGTVYQTNEDNIFELPLSSKNVILNLVTFLNEKVRFENVQLTVTNNQIKRYVSNAKFRTFALEHCIYIAENVIYSPQVSDKLSVMRWYLFKITDGKTYEWISDTNPIFRTEKHEAFTSMSFAFSSPIVMSQEFKELSFELKSTTDISIQRISYYHVKDMALLTNLKTLVNITGSMNFKTQRIGDIIQVKAVFDAANKEFGNLISVVYLNNEGDTVTLLSAQLSRSDRFINRTVVCNSTEFDCRGTECNVDDNSKDVGQRMWTVGCEPACGKCRDGFVCTTMGKCVVEDRGNLRDNGRGMWLLSVVIGFVFLL